MNKHFRIDLLLLTPVIVLVLTGLTTLSSINALYLRNQAASLVIACIIFFVLTQIDYRIFKNFKTHIYISSLVLLLIVLMIGIESRGAIRWIELFGFRVQFSEIFKPLLSLALAAHIAGNNQPKFKTFIHTILLSLPVSLLIYLQPDLGNALIFSIVLLLTLVIVGFPMRWFAVLFLSFAFLSPLSWPLLHGYQRQRIITFLYPAKDPLGASYNTIQAVIAVGSGKIFGKGLGENTQSGLRFLPERHTDFIFATISEGMGFVGTVLIIAAFAFLLYRIYRIFKNSEALFEKTFLVCCFLFFFIQFVLNIGMNVGLLPVVGVTLPFVSYGGSSLVANFIFLAIVSSISISQKKMNVLEIR